MSETFNKSLIKILRNLLSSTIPIVISLFISIPTYAISDAQRNALNEGVYYFNTEGSTCASTTGGIATLDSWMQAEAIAESRNTPNSDSGDGAYGKYQIIPSTWKGLAAAVYPPALQYANASLAPESVQDAVVYLGNLANYKNFGGDPFWLAINWYSPQGDSSYPDKNSPSLDIIPAAYAGNTETYAQYGNQIAGGISSGSLDGISLSSVSLTYNNAPDFQTYLANAGGTPTEPSNPSGSVSSSCAITSTNSCTLAGTTQAVTGPNAAILCEAEKYNGIYYLWDGGHGYQNFRQVCPEASIPDAVSSSTSGSPGPCATDCSGLVSVAVDAVYSQTFDWAVSDSTGQMVGANAQYWQSIPISQAQAGDIVTSNSGDGTATPGTDGHVEIVEYVQGNTVYTFGSHASGLRTGSISGPASGWDGGAWRYIGPGSGN